MKLFILCLCLCCNFIVMQKNYKLFRLYALNSRQRDILHVLQIANDTLIFLNGITNEASIGMDVLVNIRCESIFIFILHVHEIIYYDEGEIDLLTYENSEPQSENKTDIFYDWDTFILWIDEKTIVYPIIHKYVIGHTYEKREIFLLQISKDITKPAVYIVGGEEGRDWIPPAVIINIINKLLDVNSIYHELLDILCFYFVPILNPDGYVFSMTYDRLWAKNRDIPVPPKLCATMNYEDFIGIAVGVNLDRNWYFSKSAHIYNGECNSIHFGHTPVSQLETIALSQSLNKVASNLMAYINVRGFLKLVTVPYATPNKLSENHFLKIEIIKAACREVYQKYKNGYYYGTTEKYFFNGIGNSADWVQKNLNLPMVYTVYLKEGDKFLPQPDDIDPLSNILFTILNETLIMSYKIYKPLYDPNYE